MKSFAIERFLKLTIFVNAFLCTYKNEAQELHQKAPTEEEPAESQKFDLDKLEGQIAYLENYAQSLLKEKQGALDQQVLRNLKGLGLFDQEAQLAMSRDSQGPQNLNLSRRFQVKIGEDCFWEKGLTGFHSRALNGKKLEQIKEQIDNAVTFLQRYTEDTYGGRSVLEPQKIEICSHKLMRKNFSFDGTTLQIGVPFDGVSRAYSPHSLKDIEDAWDSGTLDLISQNPKLKALWSVANPSGTFRNQAREMLIRNSFERARQFQRAASSPDTGQSPQNNPLLEKWNPEDKIRLVGLLQNSGDPSGTYRKIADQMTQLGSSDRLLDGLIGKAMDKKSGSDVTIAPKQFNVVGVNVSNYHQVDVSTLFALESWNPYVSHIQPQPVRKLNFAPKQSNLIGVNVATPDVVSVDLQLLFGEGIKVENLERGALKELNML